MGGYDVRNRRVRSMLRNAALKSERLLQMALRGSASAWTSARRLGRMPDVLDLRGRGCHCEHTASLHLMHSEGLREACDFVVDYGTNVVNPDRGVWLPRSLRKAASGLRPGSTVHVKTNLMPEFVGLLLPSIRVPIVLVTGDSDDSPVRNYAGLLKDNRIAHWFVQNCDIEGRHPKLTRIPIGLDNPVFTKLEKRLGFAVTMLLGRTPLDLSLSRNDMGDQSLLQDIRSTLPANSERPLRFLCTFHQNQKIVAPDLSGLPPRQEAHRDLARNKLCHFVPRRLPQTECWAIHGHFAFEACPHGNGLDCFRTWEALALGTIPIVKRSSLDPLYEDNGFPVVIVSSWSEITEENLARWQKQLSDRFGASLDDKLSLAYWTGHIRTASKAACNT